MTYALWIPCDSCEEYWCVTHQMHAFECPCPEVDEVFWPYHVVELGDE